ncbi:AAA family ATPase [Sphingomonas sp. 32-62-10]
MPRPDGLAFRDGVSARALMTMTFPPIKFIVPGYIVEGLTIFAGAPKLGKSWACLGFGIAVASGGMAFGSIRCEQGAVLYLALEDNPRRLQSRLKQLRLPEMPEALTLQTEWPSLDGECLHEIETWLDGTPTARLIIIDVFARIKSAIGSKEAQYEADYRSITALQQLAGRHGIAIVLVHHTRKMDAEDPFDAVSGTRGLTGAADSVLVLKRDGVGESAVLYGRGRDLHEIETAMEFDRNTGSWRIRGDASSIAKTPERQDILDLLGRAIDPMTPTQIASALGKERTNISHQLQALFNESKVLRAKGGKWSLINPIHSVHSSHSSPERVNGMKGVNGVDKARMILAPNETGDDVDVLGGAA